MYLSLVEGMSFLTIRHGNIFPKKHPTTVEAVATLFMLGLFVLAIWAVARRRKAWVRWPLLAILVATVANELPTLVVSYRIDPPAAISDTVNYSMVAVALGCVFTPGARAWFRHRPIDPAVFD